MKLKTDLFSKNSLTEEQAQICLEKIEICAGALKSIKTKVDNSSITKKYSLNVKSDLEEISYYITICADCGRLGPVPA